ncbi:MAG: DNA polymerase III, subunit gamma and tau [Betaproteobacteria bacterium 13_1_20CM_3_63_8]|nr:MAG: DNA polymerase III, subunit gamma and tau [Betaproteobacteria bacterium 13_1_20CM_3_63_8]
MSYQVLARKWRPKRFSELAGQEHVVQALTNAIERGRLHHAYLLTGTRGVGKTTIARILAKSLNCVNGVTASPCGVCPACVDIDAGRFVDLLELDAASNTGIDNMREILDNARYAPTVGRYKVYLIDEVHMLSKAAFNSMLKTLEEPPEHVKFVLATTDPQKIPVTVLSRCLQFNLKALPRQTIAARLGEILRAEDIAFDDAALLLIAHAARGSMRDALSLLDQAIAYGAGEVCAEVVRTMLGTVETEYIYRMTDALIAADGPALLAEARALTERSLSLPSALDELAALFHRIAIAQTVPETVDALADADRVASYAKAFSAESVQLAYQICVQGRADLALAPDEPTGFAMTLLRLLAFEPATSLEANGAARPGTGPSVRAVRQNAAPSESTSTRTESRASSASKSESPPAGALASPAPRSDHVAVPVASTAAPIAEIADWPAFVAGMKLSGIALQLAAQTELKAFAGNELVLAVPEASRHLTDRAYADKLKAALDEAFGCRMRLRFEVGGAATASLAVVEKRERAEAQSKTEAAFRDDPFVQDLLARFDARIKPDSIKPVS